MISSPDSDGNLTFRTGTWYTLFVLFLVNFLNFFDRAIPAVILEPIRLEFGLSDTAMGAVGAAFTTVYALLAIPMGQWADRFSRKKLLIIGVGVWSFFTAASGVATNFALFFAARMGVGVGEASCGPAATSIIGDLVPARVRARAFGLFMLGFPLGTFAALTLGGYIASEYGWRVAFFAAALPGAIVVLMLFRSMEPPRELTDSGKGQLDDKRSFSIVLSSPLFWSISLVGVALGVAAYAMGTYLPTFFTRTYALDLTGAGASAALVLGGSGLVGLTLGGWMADRLAIGRIFGRPMMGMFACFLATPLLAFGLNAGDLTVAVGFLTAGWTLYYVFFVTAHTTLLDQFDSQLRGRVVGVFLFFSSVVGGGGGSVLAGVVSDMFAHAAIEAGMDQAVARAEGLQQALTLLVTGGFLVGGLGFLVATILLYRKQSMSQ